MTLFRGDAEANLAEYGSIFIQDGSTDQDSLGSTPVQLVNFNGIGPSSANVIPLGNQITVNSGGIYEVHLNHCSFSGSVNALFKMVLRVNGVENTSGLAFERKLGTGGDTGTATFGGEMSITAGQILTVYVETDGAGSDTITVQQANLSIKKIDNN